MSDSSHETGLQDKALPEPSDRACRYCGCMEFEDHEYNGRTFIGRHFACGAVVTPMEARERNRYTFPNGERKHLDLMLSNRTKWAADVLNLRTWGHPLNENESEELDDKARRLALKIRDAHGGHQL